MPPNSTIRYSRPDPNVRSEARPELLRSRGWAVVCILASR